MPPLLSSYHHYRLLLFLSRHLPLCSPAAPLQPASLAVGSPPLGNQSYLTSSQSNSSLLQSNLYDPELQPSSLECAGIYPLESSPLNLYCRYLVYMLEVLQLWALACIIHSGLRRPLAYTPADPTAPGSIAMLVLLLLRVLVPGLYTLLTPHRTIPHYLLAKVLQLVSLFLLDMPEGAAAVVVGCVVLLGEYMADLVYICTREQRYGYFDSRLGYGYYIYRVSATYLGYVLYMLYDDSTDSAHVEPGMGTISMLVVVLVVSAVHLVCVGMDSLYSPITVNTLLGLWLICVANAAYFTLLAILANMQQQSSAPPGAYSLYILPSTLSTLCIALLFSNRYQLGTWSWHGYGTLLQDYHKLDTRQAKLAYLWEAIRLVSLGRDNLHMLHQLVTGINWVLSRSCYHQVCQHGSAGAASLPIPVRRRKGQGIQNAQPFFNKFVEHCYQLMQDSFASDPEIKHMLMFVFNKRSAEKMLLYVDKQEFYDVREYARVMDEHRGTDIAAKIGEMERNQAEVNTIVRAYVKRVKKLIDLVYDSSSGIDLEVCGRLGEEIVAMQDRIFAYGADNGTPFPSKQLKHHDYIEESQSRHFGNNPSLLSANPSVLVSVAPAPILSEYSRNLLNIFRHVMLSMPPLNLNQEHAIVSEITNQEEPLLLVSAQPDSMGKVLALNPAASKLTYYPEEQLVGSSVSLLLPDLYHHLKSTIFKAFTTTDTTLTSNGNYHAKQTLPITKKNKYCTVCEINVRYIDGTMGKRWLVKLRELSKMVPALVVSQENIVMGFNEAAYAVGIGFDWMGVDLGEWFLHALLPKADTLEGNSSPSVTTDIGEILQKSNFYSRLEPAPKLPQPGSRRSIHSRRSINSRNSIHSGEHLEPKGQRRRSSMMQLNSKIMCMVQCSVMEQLKLEGSQGMFLIKVEDKSRRYGRGQLNLQFCESTHMEGKRAPSPATEAKVSPSKINHSSNQNMLNLTEVLELNQDSFQFHYDMRAHAYTNNPQKPQQSEQSLGSASRECSLASDNYKYEEQVKDESYQEPAQKSSGKPSGKPQLKPAVNVRFPEGKFYSEKSNPTPTEVYHEDINQLIYINGELQFRENKRLEQRYQCETHPLHVSILSRGQKRNQVTGMLRTGEFNYSDQLPQPQIESKAKIYELLGEPINGLGGNGGIIKYPLQNKLLIAVLVVFVVVFTVVVVVGTVTIGQVNANFEKRLKIMSTMGMRCYDYNLISNSFTQLIILGINPYITNTTIVTETNTYADNLTNIMGQPGRWLDWFKDIEKYSSQIADIEDIERDWKQLTFSDQIPGFTTESIYGDQSEVFIISMQQLRDMIIGSTSAQQVTYRLDVNQRVQLTVEPRLLNKTLQITAKLVGEILPLNLHLLYKISALYHHQLGSLHTTLTIATIILVVMGVVLGLVAACMVYSIRLARRYNMEIFSFFPAEYLEDFSNKLDKIEELVLSNSVDANSVIGIEDVNEDIVENGRLIFHKKKILKSQDCHIAELGICLLLVLFASGLAAILNTGLVEAEQSEMLERWYFLNNARLLNINYLWQQKVLELGIAKQPTFAAYFANKMVNMVNSSSLYVGLGLQDKVDFITLYAQYYESVGNRRLSAAFLADVKAMDESLYCSSLGSVGSLEMPQLQEDSRKCQANKTGFFINDLYEYTQVKKYIVNFLLQDSLDNNQPHKFTSALSFFNRPYSEGIDWAVLERGQKMVLAQLAMRRQATDLDLSIGLLSTGVLLALAVACIALWVHRARVHIIEPILVLTRVFPLVVLNSNHSFLEWYRVKKNEELR